MCHRSQASKASSSAAIPIGRAFSLLCVASSLAGQSFVAPVQQASALAVPSGRRAGEDFEAARFPAGFARESSQQSNRQPKQHYVSVGDLPKSSHSAGRYAFVNGVEIDTGYKGPAVVEGSSGNSTKAPEQAKTETNQTANTVPSGRWGQTATYLPGEKTVVFVGGQVANGSSLTLTNDIFALNISSLATNSTSGPLQPWQQLSSAELPAHAFASSVVTSVNGTDQLWLIGGYTNNCSDAAAWTWSPSGGNGLNNSWLSIDLPASSQPPRRARATAIEVPTHNSTETSYLLLGGKKVAAQCASQSATVKRETTSPVTADLWTLPATFIGNTAADRGSNPVSVQTWAVDSSHGEFSLLDYSTVTLPTSSAALSDKGTTLFLGGLTASSQFASFEAPWKYDPWTGAWNRLATTGEVPEGRRGHTSTLLKDGRVVVLGGILQNGTVTSEVYVLDPAQTPAEWKKVTFAADETIASPAKAYHSTVLINDVLVMGFGGSISEEKNTRSTSPSILFYLDTASPNNWRWSDSIEGVLESRGVVASGSANQQNAAVSTINNGEESSKSAVSAAPDGSQTSPKSPEGNAGATSESSTDASSVENNGSSANVGDSPSSVDGASSVGTKTGSDNGEVSQSTSSPAQAAAANSASPAPTSSSNSDNSSDSSSGTKAAVAGGLLGAAALAAVCGGLYAYKKRRDAHQHGNMQSEETANSAPRGSRPSLPPVSALWFNNVKPKRAENEEAEASFTQSPAGGSFQVVRKMPGRKSLGPRESGWAPSFMQGNDNLVTPYVMSSAARPDTVCDDPYLSLDQTPFVGATHQLLGPPTNASSYPRFGKSSDSLANDISDGEASHFSYPYLSGMHRASVGGNETYEASPSTLSGTPLSAFLPTEGFCTPDMAGLLSTPVVPAAEAAGQGRRSSAPVAAFMGPRSGGNRIASASVITNQAMANGWRPELAPQTPVALAPLATGDDPFADKYGRVAEADELRTDVAIQGSENDSGTPAFGNYGLPGSVSYCAGLSAASPSLGQQECQKQQTGRRVFSDGSVSVHQSAGPSAFVGAQQARIASARRAKRSQLRVMNPTNGTDSDF